MITRSEGERTNSWKLMLLTSVVNLMKHHHGSWEAQITHDLADAECVEMMQKKKQICS